MTGKAACFKINGSIQLVSQVIKVWETFRQKLRYNTRAMHGFDYMFYN